MLTETHLTVLNTLPDATYWEDVIINHFQRKNGDLYDVVSDLFVWMSVSQNGKKSYKYCCLIPDRHIMWKVMIKLFSEAYEIPSYELIKTLKQWLQYHLITYGEQETMNIYWGRFDWLNELDFQELMDTDWKILIDELGKELISNFQFATPEIKQAFFDKIKWLPQNSQEQLTSP